MVHKTNSFFPNGAPYLFAQFDTNIDFLAPTVFKFGKIPDFTPYRSFKRAVPHRNDVIIEKNLYITKQWLKSHHMRTQAFSISKMVKK